VWCEERPGCGGGLGRGGRGSSADLVCVERSEFV